MGSFEASAYGPPWGGIEGGVFGARCSNTSTGVKLCKGVQKLAIAVNPSVITYGTKVKINPNPFKDANLVFTAVDTGGYGNSVPRWVDFFVASGRTDQNKWGRRQVKVYKVGKGSPKDVATLGEGGSQSSGAATLPFTKNCEYEGKQQTDPISRAVAWRTGDSRYSRCYVAAINSWYQAIVADPEPGGSGNIDAGGPVRAAIVKIALREAKLSDKWPAHANNCGPPKTRYFPGSEWPCGTPWCALFTTWVWKKAGINFAGSASVSSLSVWGKEKKLYKSGPHNNPQPGDMVMKNGAHVALVTKVTSPHNIDTVGGNEGVDNVVLQKGYHPTARGWTHYVSPPGPSSTSEAGSLAWPLAGEVTLEFGKRRTVGRTTGPRNNGINIKTDSGTDVKAAAAGKVTLASEVSGLGNYVCIMHPQFGLTTCYAYNDKVTVSTGDSVKKGQVIGKSGAMLHFEVREGLNPGDKAVDPQKYLKKR